jgi:signal recognition particle subunit SRP54
VFESLSQRLEGVWQRLRGRGHLTAEDVDAALREVRLALLEADVHFRVVRDFVERIRARAVGDEVLKSLTPAQQVVKIVHEELCALMGGTGARLASAPQPPTIVLLCGLQGAGKTTFAAKLAGLLQRQGRRPLLAACDLQRPAAVEQLQVVGRQVGVPVVAPAPGDGPADVAARAVAEARRHPADTVIVDTAGRSQADAALMEELRGIRDRIRPHEVLLVLDALAGQDAANVARGFAEGVGVDGVALTRLDSDARGGAALSVRAVIDRPIKFAGTGERLDAIEPFHPERMASRILGMGDVLSLIERAEAAWDQDRAADVQRRLRSTGLTLDDFLEQMQAVRRMGPLQQVLGMIPGLGSRLPGGMPQVDEKDLGHVEAIIRSMTPEERRRPEILNGSRRLRIARGSGTAVADVNRLLRQFDEVRRLLRAAAQGRLPPGLGGVPGVLPGAPPRARSKGRPHRKGSGKRGRH